MNECSVLTCIKANPGWLYLSLRGFCCIWTLAIESFFFLSVAAAFSLSSGAAGHSPPAPVLWVLGAHPIPSPLGWGQLALEAGCLLGAKRWYRSLLWESSTFHSPKEWDVNLARFY